MKKNRTLLLLLPAFLVLLALVLAGCKDFSFYGVLGDRIDDTPLQIAPAAASVAEVSGMLSFSATGGTPPYSYSVIPGTGTGSIVASTGAFTAGTVGSVTVRVTDSKGRTSDAAITITPTGAVLAISPVNVSLSLGGGLTFVASGGTPPYTFIFTSTGSGSPTINVPGAGDYVAGLTPGIDAIEVQDFIGATAPATVNVSAATPTVDYSVTGFSISGSVKGGSLVSLSTARFTLQNGGIADGVEDIYYWVYLSDDVILSSGDTLLDADSTPALSAGPGTNVDIDGSWPLASGTKNLFILVSAVDDINAANNTSSAFPVTLQLPDYSGSLAHTGGTTAGAAFTGTLTIDNIGTADGSQDVSWSVFASLGDTGLGMDDKIVASGSIPGGIGTAAAPAVIPIGNTWPSAAGSYFLVAVISATDEIDAAGNQPSDGPVAVAAAPAPAVDYSGTVSTGTPTRAGGSFSATLTVNNGPVGGSSTVYWSVYASPGDTVINAGDKLVGSGSFAGLGASGSSGALPIDSSWPAATGNYYLVAQILADDETAPANNTPASAVVAVGATDYSGAVAHTGGTTAGVALTGTLTISNIGGAYALGGAQALYWNVYASLDDTVISTDDKVVGSGVIAGGLGAGANSGALAIGNTWPSTAGNYYLIADLFAGDDAVSGNNRPVTAVIAVAAPPAANVNYGGAVAHSVGFTAGAAFTGTVTISNGGTTNGAQDVSWYVYASLANATIEAGDTLVASGSVPGGLAASGSTGAMVIGNTWPAVAGTYYLVADIQASDDANLTNNRPASGAVVVAPAPVPAPDYGGTVSTGAPTRAGGPFNATLTVNNGAAVAGASTVYWSVYASLGDTVIDAGDKLVGSGSFAALGPLGSSGALPISSSWTAATGDYYLVARILADDETAPANNTPFSAVVAVGATDYSGAAAHTGGTTAGAGFTGTLTISNNGGPYALAGSQNLYWNVYASLNDTVISPDDKVVGSGMIASGLLAGANSGALLIGSTWPTAAGNYYLIADLFAGDDANSANDQPASGPVSVGAVDYTGSVTPGAGTTANRPFTGSLTIDNPGNRNGAAALFWTAYASLGNTTIDGADKVVGSGTIAGGLGAGGSSGPLALGSTWPAAAGAYYLVVEVSASDDYLTGNNRFASGVVAVTSPNVDYTVLNVTYDPSAPSTTTPGGVVLGTFDYRNAGTDAGVQTVFWTAYASRNTTLDASDTWIASGIAGPLAGLSTSAAPVNFSGNWPLDYGSYYLLIMVSEIEDVNGANNRVASAATTSIGMFTGPLDENNNEPNNDWTTLLEPNVYDLGVSMDPGMSLYMEGSMTGPPTVDLDDVIGVKSATATTLTASMAWGANEDIALYIWEGPPRVGVKAVSITAATSLAISWPAVPGTQYWIDITNSGSKNIGPYTLIITAN